MLRNYINNYKMPRTYRQIRRQSAARTIQRAAIAMLRRKANRRARPRPSTRRATRPLTRGDVLKIIKSKQDPKVYKTPSTSCNFATTTSNTTTLCRNLVFLAGANDYQGTSFIQHQWKFPLANGIYNDTNIHYGDTRPSTSGGPDGTANPDRTTIILNRLTARIDYTSHTGQDYMLCWYVFRLEKTTTVATFSANLLSNKIIVPYKSYLTSHQQRNEQDVRAITKDQKVIQSGKFRIKRSTPYNDSPLYKTLKVSVKFGKNGKKIRFSSDEDIIGDIGVYMLVTSCTAINGNLIGNASSTGLIHTGILNTYFNHELSNV